MTRHSTVTSIALLALAAVSACSDNGPTNPQLHRNSGVVSLPPGASAVLLAFTPASAVDSVRVGVPAGGFVSQTAGGRVIAYGAPGLGSVVRFQVYGRNVSSGAVVQMSDAQGRLLSSTTATVLFDR